MRVYNFSPGPAVLPLPVLEQAQRELVEHEGHGMSVMEMSHRSPMFEDIIHGAEASLRKLMGIADNYKVLFLHGGASMQFAMVPMNLLKTRADYVVTGEFASKACKEAQKFGSVKVAASSKEQNFSCIPRLAKDMFSPDADYVHITTNNTIYGTRYTSLPDVGAVPLVADMSSNILSEPMDVSRYGLIYAGAQKNIGPAGLTVVIIRDDLIAEPPPQVPTMLSYQAMAKSESMYNTPSTFGIYIAFLVFNHLLAEGGLTAMKQKNEHKAKLLYDCLDESKLFAATAAKEDRSLMNVTFVLPSDELNAAFVKEAAASGLVNLKGHRSVGGMRASIYNAMPVEGVQKLVDFMKSFESRNKA